MESTAPSLTEWFFSTMNLRHVFLLMITWMLARAVDLLQTIVQATQLPTPTEKSSVSEPTVASSGGAAFKAGASVPEVPEDTTGVKHSWCPLKGSDFKVRCGPNYSRNGFKKPSKEALAKVEGVDLFYTKRKVFNLLQYGHIELPEATPGWDEPYPEFFVVNQMLPLNFVNKLFPSAAECDGETMNLVIYARMPAGLGKGWNIDDGDPEGAGQVVKR